MLGLALVLTMASLPDSRQQVIPVVKAWCSLRRVESKDCILESVFFTENGTKYLDRAAILVCAKGEHHVLILDNVFTNWRVIDVLKSPVSFDDYGAKLTRTGSMLSPRY